MSLDSKSFFYRENKLFCENVEIESFIQSIPNRASQANINGKLYAIKANSNLHILKALKSYGVQMPITVSGNEILASLAVGYLPENILFNGNGKQEWEIKLAIEQGVLMNVDSIFDAKKIVSIAKNHFPTKTVKVLLRAKPSPLQSISLSVHPYVNTSDTSKFGFSPENLDKVLDVLAVHDKICIEGIHCHLGSCIDDPTVFTYTCEFLNDISSELRKRNITVKLVDIGGGIGINYHTMLPGIEQIHGDAISNLLKENNVPGENEIPTVEKFLEAITPFVPKNATILLEPGRSLVGNSGILISKVLGLKDGGLKHYTVVDASMAEIIRPCLYNAHHQIFPIRIHEGRKWDLFDVVGPICETADFLGVDIPLQLTKIGDVECTDNDYLAIMDCGAYGSSMSSNYNMKPRPQEILVEGSTWRCIRQRDSYEDIVSRYLF